MSLKQLLFLHDRYKETSVCVTVNCKPYAPGGCEPGRTPFDDCRLLLSGKKTSKNAVLIRQLWPVRPAGEHLKMLADILGKIVRSPPQDASVVSEVTM